MPPQHSPHRAEHSPGITFVTDLHSPAVPRAVAELGAEGAGVGGQVPVSDGEDLGLGAAVANGDVPGLSLRAMVVHVKQGEEESASACGGRRACRGE